MNSKTRIAVAGAGYIGRAHMAVAQQSGTCTLSAIVDPSPAAAAIAARPACRSTGRSMNCSNGTVRTASMLATPNQLHVEHALTCLAAGVPTLLEKPIAPTVEEAQALVD